MDECIHPAYFPLDVEVQLGAVLAILPVRQQTGCDPWVRLMSHSDTATPSVAANDVDDQAADESYVVVQNPRKGESFLARRLSRNKLTAVEPEAMAREDEHEADAAAPATGARIRVPSLLRHDPPGPTPPATALRVTPRLSAHSYDYIQADFCGPNKTGLAVKLRRKLPKHLRTLGVTNA